MAKEEVKKVAGDEPEKENPRLKQLEDENTELKEQLAKKIAQEGRAEKADEAPLKEETDKLNALKLVVMEVLTKVSLGMGLQEGRAILVGAYRSLSKEERKQKVMAFRDFMKRVRTAAEGLDQETQVISAEDMD